MREIKGSIFLKLVKKQICARLARRHLNTKRTKSKSQKNKDIVSFFLIHFFFRAHDHGIIGVRGEYRPMNSKLKMI